MSSSAGVSQSSAREADDEIAAGSFRPLDASRLTFGAGLGKWDLGRWLPPDKAMGYVEPAILERPAWDPRCWNWPGAINSDDDEWLALYGKLHDAGVLGLMRGPVSDVRTCAAFNVVKDSDRDRLIVDRRGPTVWRVSAPQVLQVCSFRHFG